MSQSHNLSWQLAVCLACLIETYQAHSNWNWRQRRHRTLFEGPLVSTLPFHGLCRSCPSIATNWPELMQRIIPNHDCTNLYRYRIHFNFTFVSSLVCTSSSINYLWKRGSLIEFGFPGCLPLYFFSSSYSVWNFSWSYLDHTSLLSVGYCELSDINCKIKR